MRFEEAYGGWQERRLLAQGSPPSPRPGGGREASQGMRQESKAVPKADSLFAIKADKSIC